MTKIAEQGKYINIVRETCDN